jgi:ankyrin repeat protein
LFVERGADDADIYPDLLYSAVGFGWTDMVEGLINKGVDVNTQLRGYAPSLATVWGRKQPLILELLLARGADPNATDEYGWSLLHYAADSQEITKLLLDHGAKPNVRERGFGYTPLHWAARNGHAAVVQLLVEHGANVNAKDYEEETALRRAREYGHEEIAQLLRKHGAKE